MRNVVDYLVAVADVSVGLMMKEVVVGLSSLLSLVEQTSCKVCRRRVVVEESKC
jgi:hypothetical protein